MENSMENHQKIISILQNNAAHPFDEYELEAKILDRQIREPNVHNIAVSAVYGAGKSSVIQTYLSNFRNDKKDSYVKVELAGFQNKVYKEAEVERGILQQLLYSVKGKKLPNSKIERTDRTPWRALFYTICVIAILASCLLLAFDSIGKIDWPKHALIILYFIAFACFGLILWAVINFNHISRIKYKDLEADFNKKTSEYVPSNLINKFLDEVLYFFECTKVDLVIIEDIDRLADQGFPILVKLRELNTLINSSNKIKRKVTFVYAIRDDIFSSSEEHAKFFDYILSITAVVNPLTVADKLSEKINSDNIESCLRLSKRLISNVSIYITDMRILNNTFNDYLLFYMKLHDAKNQSPHKFENDKLFALCLYKNLYPADYAELQKHNRGIFATILNMDRIYANALKEVNEMFPRGEGNTPREKDIIQRIRKRHATLAEILEIIKYDRIFLKRKDEIKASLPNTSIKDFDDIWPLLISLMRRGFIDECYLDYISAIEYHTLTASDMSFILKTLRVGKSDFDFKFDNLHQALEYMNDEDFSESGIVNFDILSALEFIKQLDIKHLTHKFTNLIQTLLSDDTSCKLLANFVKKVSDEDLLQIVFDELLVKKDMLVHSLLNDKEIEGWKKDKIVACLIVAPADITKLNYENCITSYCEKHPDFTECYIGVTNESLVVAFLNKIKPVFEHLPIIKEESIRNCIIDNRYYHINTNNLRMVLPIDLNNDTFVNKNYFAVSQNSKVKSYVDAEISDYVSKVLFDKSILGLGNDQIAFDILMNNSIDQNSAISFIHKFDFSLIKIRGINEKLIDEILDYDRMESTWENILDVLMITSLHKVFLFLLRHKMMISGQFGECRTERRLNFFEHWVRYKFVDFTINTFVPILPSATNQVQLTQLTKEDAIDSNLCALITNGNIIYGVSDWEHLASYPESKKSYLKYYNNKIIQDIGLFFKVVERTYYGIAASSNANEMLRNVLHDFDVSHEIKNALLNSYSNYIKIDSEQDRIIYTDLGRQSEIKLPVDFLVRILKNCGLQDQVRLIANRVIFDDISLNQMLQLLNAAGGDLAKLVNGKFASLKLSPFNEAKVIIAKVKDLGIREFYLNNREVKNEVVIRPKANS